MRCSTYRTKKLITRYAKRNCIHTFIVSPTWSTYFTCRLHFLNKMIRKLCVIGIAYYNWNFYIKNIQHLNCEKSMCIMCIILKNHDKNIFIPPKKKTSLSFRWITRIQVLLRWIFNPIQINYIHRTAFLYTTCTNCEHLNFLIYILWIRRILLHYI